MPIWAIDLDGLEPEFAADKSDDAIHYAPKESEKSDPYAGDKPWIANEQNMWVELHGAILPDVVVTGKAPVAKAPSNFSNDAGQVAGVIFKPMIDIGGAIKKEGDEMEVAGLGVSVEVTNGARYAKFSAERFSTTPENGASRYKAEGGVRLDLALSNEPEGWKRKAKYNPLTLEDNTTIEGRLYFHCSDRPFDPSDVGGMRLKKAFSVNETVRVPLFRKFGGVYYSYDAIAEKNEFGFYFIKNTNTNKPDKWNFKESSTIKAGVAVKAANDPNN
jgi:hypothetical protein